MITLRKAMDRGHTQTNWLDSWHTFSFDRYHDPNFMHFSDLRVINEDFVEPGAGFGRHPHKNMEIITYVVSGALEHKDSLGTGSIIVPGEVQRMTAGLGIEHSEFNHWKNERLHLLQIWIRPEALNIKPGYEQKTISDDHNAMVLIASREGGPNAVSLHQDAKIYVAKMSPASDIHFSMSPNRRGWVQVIKGKIDINTTSLNRSDGASVQDESLLTITCSEEAEFLFFDLR